MPGELETVHATIAGDPSVDPGRRSSPGHLYEGYLKQGANDDNSGCALTLEVGRAYIKLVAEGKLPKPKRTIHFQWVPEISGTQRLARRRIPTSRSAIVARSELRHGRHPPVDVAQLLDPAADAGHLPVVPQRHRRRA